MKSNFVFYYGLVDGSTVHKKCGSYLLLRDRITGKMEIRKCLIDGMLLVLHPYKSNPYNNRYQGVKLADEK